MNWKELFDSLFPEYKNGTTAADRETLKDFISTEIIEKLIAEIPENMMNGYKAPGANITTVKQQLRDKWL